MKAPLFVLAAALALPACSDDSPEENQIALPVGTQIAENGVVVAPASGTKPNIPVASGAGTAFGLTRQQLEDARLLGAGNADLAEVDHVTTDAQGNVNALVVEIEAQPDRDVLVPLKGLEPVAINGQWHLRANTLTREQLLTYPEVKE